MKEVSVYGLPTVLHVYCLVVDQLFFYFPAIMSFFDRSAENKATFILNELVY